MSSSSVKRVFSSVRAVINLAGSGSMALLGDQCLRSGTFIPDDQVAQETVADPSVKHSVEHPARMHGTGCDEPRWLIALISDTGMRRVPQPAACRPVISISMATRLTSTLSSISRRRLKTVVQQQAGAAGGSLTLGSAQDQGYDAPSAASPFPQTPRRGQVQCEL